jgi:xylulokinase
VSLLGIDVGTTACKVAAFAEDGCLLASASREYPLRSRCPDHLEIDPDEVWTAVVDGARRVNDRLGHTPVEAVAVSSQGEAVTPVGLDGGALAPSPVTFDNRATAQATRLAEQFGRTLLARITGQPPHPMFTIAKLMWWQEHDPDLVRRTWKFLCYGDFVGVRLGVEPAIDHSMAARTMAFDIRTRRWSAAILAAARIDEEKLSTPVPAGTVIGRVGDQTAAELGFRGRPLVVAGGHDQACGAFGAGVAADGEAMFAIGTTTCLAPIFPEPRNALLDRGYPCYPHIVPGRYISLAGNFTGGSLLRWYRDAFGEPERREGTETGRDVYEILAEAAGDAPSPLLVLPHFAGSGAPHSDPRSKGAILGLTFTTGRNQIIRSLLEGVMFEMAVNRDCLAEAGVPLAATVATGGGARSDRWLQIAADILGLPVHRSLQQEAACWGAARLAGIGAGILPPSTFFTAPEAGTVETSVFEPDARRSEYYRDRLDTYRAVYAALKSINHRL